jgi:hypothetical protein
MHKLASSYLRSELLGILHSEEWHSLLLTFRGNYRSHLKESSLTPGDGTDRLSRNVSKKL